MIVEMFCMMWFIDVSVECVVEVMDFEGRVSVSFVMGEWLMMVWEMMM